MRSAEEHAAAAAIIQLMRGVVYREQDETTWTTLDRNPPPVRGHFAAIGVNVIIDYTEGDAYLQTDLTARVDELAALPVTATRALVIENEITFLSAPVPRDGAKMAAASRWLPLRTCAYVPIMTAAELCAQAAPLVLDEGRLIPAPPARPARM